MLNIQTRSADYDQQAMYTARKVDPLSLGPMSQNNLLYTQNESRRKQDDSRWRVAGNKEPFDLYQLIDDFGNWFDMVLDNRGYNLSIRASSALPRFFHGDRLMLGFLLWDIASYSQTYLGTGDVLLEIDSELVRDNWYSIYFSLCSRLRHSSEKEKGAFLSNQQTKKKVRRQCFLKPLLCWDNCRIAWRYNPRQQQYWFWSGIYH